MFGAIMINAIFMLFLVLRVKGAGKAVAFMGIPLAVLTTFLADVFLVLTKDLAAEGVIRFMSAKTATLIGFFIFGLVQVVYAFYLKPTKLRIVIRVAFYLLFVALVFALDMLTLDRFIACLSMSQLILNVVFAWVDHGKDRTRASLLLAVGMTLFLLCDAFISVRMMLPSDTLVYEIIRFMVWVFYIPSQALLSTAYLADRTNA